jgi:hypothetical protein
MTISSDLFPMTLAMDSYNRGYGGGLNTPGNSLAGLSMSESLSRGVAEAASDRASPDNPRRD